MKDGYEVNIKLINLVKQRPSLYDNKRCDYNDKNEHYKSWHEISKELREPILEVKDRWKNLRVRYVSHMRKLRAPNPSKKAIRTYYLAEHLKFLDAFIKPNSNKKRKTKVETPKVTQVADDEDMDVEETAEPDYLDTNENTESDNIESNTPTHSYVREPSPIPEYVNRKQRNNEPRSKRKAKTNHETHRQHAKEYSQKNINLDPDLAFLKSVVPDMKSMTNRQKRNFKMGILAIVDDILTPGNIAFTSTIEQEDEKEDSGGGVSEEDDSTQDDNWDDEDMEPVIKLEH